MTIGFTMCAVCSRNRRDLTCEAFPDGIPDGIFDGDVDHRQPVDGDHGLQFAPMEPDDEAMVASAYDGETEVELAAFAKDALGHGSEKRGGRRVQAGEAELRPGDERNVSRIIKTDMVGPDGEPMSNTEQGRTFEGMLLTVGAKQMNKRLGTNGVTRISSSDGGSTTTPIDIVFGDMSQPGKHYAGELKTRDIGVEGKVSISKSAKARKLEAVKETSARPITVVQVVDQEARTVHVHVVTDEFKSFRYANRKPDYSYEYTDNQFEDAWKAAGYE